jgi:5-methylcytosine-specific restriction endonuclease McrBC GTP-binding regulatory subunit McrB
MRGYFNKFLEKQVEVYERANSTKKSIKVIIYFSKSQLDRVVAILKRLGLEKDKSIVLIDARRDNKVSASKVLGTR